MKTLFRLIRALSWATLLMVCAVAARADAVDEVRHEAAQVLLHHTVYLRDPYSATYLHFDENGEILNGAREGHWSDSGAVYATRVEVWPSGMLHVEAERVAVGFNQHKGKWEEIRRQSATVVIEVQFALTHLNAEQARKTLRAIFALRREELVPDLLPYWRPCVAGELKKDPADHDRVFCFDKGMTPDMASHAPVPNNVPTATGVIVPPHAIESPQPRFTEVARELKSGGTSVLWVVVDEQGRPAVIYVASPLGYGLDDQAVNAIAKWHFRPARLNGKPIRVQMTVEVNFKTPTAFRRMLPW